MPTNLDAAFVSLGTALYPNWVLKPKPKPKGSDIPRPYRTPREGASRDLTIEEELDADSVFDPLKPASQSSQPLDSQHSSTPDTTTGAAGPKTPPHFSETLASIPSFNLTLLGMPVPMLPVTDGKNALLNLVPGSPVKQTAPPGLGRGLRGSRWSSCSNSPMSLGYPAITSSLMTALKVRARSATPALFNSKEELSEESSDKEEMDTMDDGAKDGVD